jgi:phosphate transport system substrate-binding protein
MLIKTSSLQKYKKYGKPYLSCIEWCKRQNRIYSVKFSREVLNICGIFALMRHEKVFLGGNFRMENSDTVSKVVNGCFVAVLVLLLLGTILFGFGVAVFIGAVGTSYGALAFLCFTSIICVFWVFCIFSVCDIFKLKLRLIVFGTIAAVLAVTFTYANKQHNIESARLREIETARRRETEERMQTPGVSQNIDLQNYAPFGHDSRVAILEEESTLRFRSVENLPRLDGATALYPVYSAFVRAVYPQNTHAYYLRCTTTGTAYENLINGEVDVIFVAGISNEHNAFARRMGVQLEFTPIGRDAFVFFVNSANPVDSLTTAQIRDIYSGRITNWRELGGEDVEIFPYQREANSGSQTAMEIFMGNTGLMQLPTEEVVAGAMRGVIRDVEARHHKNLPNAIGYSFLYFATEMAEAEQIKLLALDGVAPTRENIVNETYSQAGYFYAVTVKGSENEIPTISQFIEWILSEQGQYLIKKTGYTPLH